MRTTLRTLALLALLTGTASASGIPDLGNSHWACRTDEDVVVLVCPAGDGTTLDAARPVGGGAPVDATIDAWIIDGAGYPVALYPFEDIWLYGYDLSACPGGTVAEANTDIQGHTTFRVLHAGGRALGDVRVILSGEDITGSAPNLTLISPDGDGDGVVDIADWSMLGYRFSEGVYDLTLDLDADGDLDLTDAVLMIQHDGHDCP